jgi:hypothetical protein
MHSSYLELGNLLFWIVLEQVSESLLVALHYPAELLFKDFLIEDVAHAEAAAGHLGAVCWAFGESVS